MMKRGLFGWDLKNQVQFIGVTYIVFSVLGIVFGFLLLDNPEGFIHEDNAKNNGKNIMEEEGIFTDMKDIDEDISFGNYSSSELTTMIPTEDDDVDKDDDSEEISLESTDEPDDFIVKDDISETLLEYGEEDFNVKNVVKREVEQEEETEEEVDNLEQDIFVDEQLELKKNPKDFPEAKYRLMMRNFIQNEGIEAIIGSFLKLICSMLLIQGVRTGKHWLLVPWLVEEIVEMIGGFFYFTVQMTRTTSWSIGGMILVILIYILGGYLMYSVASYHTILRRMNKNSDQIISSVCQGGFQVGNNYQRLEEDAWQSQPNLASEFRDDERSIINKFGRPKPADQTDGFTREKKVEMDNDEHVLYVQ